MSIKYKEYGSVPTEVLAHRLEQLSDAVGKSSFEMLSEYTRRVPAELDRDADLVLSQSARRMTELTAERDAYKLALLEIENPVQFMLKHAEASGAQIDGVMARTLSNDVAYLKDIATTVLLKQAEEL